MCEIAICEKFNWTLDHVRNISISDYRGVVKYMKKQNTEHKKAMRKAKQRK